MVDTQHDEDQYIQAFLTWRTSGNTWCQGTKGTKNETQARYIPNSILRSYFHEPRCTNNLLNALYPDGDSPDATIVTNHYMRPFAILLSLGCGRLIRLFIRYEDLQDDKLPFRSKPQNFPQSSSKDLWTDFSLRQWEFCAPTLEYSRERVLDQHEILPLRFEEVLGRGGTSSVQKITVHPVYNQLYPKRTLDPNSTAEQRNTFVVKTYRGQEAEDYYNTERRAYDKLKWKGQPPPNIISYHGSFVRQHTYNIILEYADKATLEQYMASNFPPSDGKHILIFWRRLFALFAGLGRIHSVDKSEEGLNIMSGWHQDIKPANILIKSQNRTSIYDYDFLIADLGLTHFKRVVEKQQGASDADSFGTYAYGAPETFRFKAIEDHKLQVYQQVDLWSLGCVFSEVATWIVGGGPKVREYRQRRQQEAAKCLGEGHGDIFHDGQKLLKVVGQSHDSVIRSCRRDDFVTERVLLGPVADMLQEEPGKRKECQRLYGRTDGIISEAEIDLQNAVGKARNGAPQIEDPPPNPTNIVNSALVPSMGPQPDLIAPATQYPVNIRHRISQVDRTPPILDDSPKTAKSEPPPSLLLEDALEIIRLRPWLSKAHFAHEKLLVNLINMDHIFLIDNSRSMNKHKSEVKEVLEVLGYFVKRFNDRGIDMHFTTSPKIYKHCKTSTALLKALMATEFGSKSDMGTKLDALLREYTQLLDGQKIKGRGLLDRLKTSSPHRGISMYVLTDGLWQQGTDVSKAVKNMVHQLNTRGLQKSHMGIQFIRFGDDPKAIETLEFLDDKLGLKLDIVDTTPANGNVLKMLLGATNNWFDGQQNEAVGRNLLS